MFIYFPDPALRQPWTLAAVFPLFLSYYVQAVLAILPNTFVLKLLLLPFILWQAWRCAVGLDFGAFVAQLFGYQGADGLAFLNVSFVNSMFCIGLRVFEWTFINKPLRRYESSKRDQGTPTERRPSASTIIPDAFDLLTNQRGIGWSWSQDPFPRGNTPPPLITISAKTLLKLTVFDASQYIIQLACPAVNNPKGGGIFDPSLTFVPRTALAAFCGICGGVWTYAMVDSTYHIYTLIGRIVFRQPASAWPRLFRRPWMSTSIQEFWSFRWHQILRHLFIVFGARPGGALFGKPGALMGAFAVSAILHHIGFWGAGKGTEFVTGGGFFLLMGVGTIIEWGFKRVTGLQVRGWLGWSWTMLWTTLCGTFMFDGWARHGAFAIEYFPDGFRPGKLVVDAIVARLSSK